MAKRITEVAPADAELIIATLCTMYDIVRERITTEACRQKLETGLYDLMHRGALPIATVLAWARAGLPAADAAVRRYAYELWHAQQSRPPDVEAYIMGIIVEPVIPKYPRGHVETIDTWYRGIGIAVMIDLTSKGTGLPATRSRATETPSAGYFVTEMLVRKGHRTSKNNGSIVSGGNAAGSPPGLRPSCLHLPFKGALGGRRLPRKRVQMDVRLNQRNTPSYEIPPLCRFEGRWRCYQLADASPSH